MLADLIKHPDYSWKEAKKVLKKDSRYEFAADNLEKSEREKFFDDHIGELIPWTTLPGPDTKKVSEI